MQFYSVLHEGACVYKCNNCSCLCTWENGNLGAINGGHGGHSRKRHTFKHHHTGVHDRYHSSRPLYVNLGGHWETELSEPCCPMLRLAQDVIVPSPVPPISLLLATFGGHSSGEEPIKTCLPELPQKPCTCKYRTLLCHVGEWSDLCPLPSTLNYLSLPHFPSGGGTSPSRLTGLDFN